MKSFLSHTLLFCFMLTCIIVYGQNNTNTLRTANGNTFYLNNSFDQEIEAIGNGEYIYYPKNLQKEHSAKSTANTHTLTIDIDGNWMALYIRNYEENYLLTFIADSYPEGHIETVISEGLHDIYVSGKNDSGYDSRLFFTEINIDSDTEMSMNMNDDAIHKISVTPYDENSNTMDEKTFVSAYTSIQINSRPDWQGIGTIMIISYYDTHSYEFYTNDLSPQVRMAVFDETLTKENEFYHISFPVVTEGVYQDLTFENNPDDFYHITHQYNNISTQSKKLCVAMAVMNIIHFENDSLGFSESIAARSNINIHYDSPLKIYANAKITENPVVGSRDVFVAPIVYLDTLDQLPFYTMTTPRLTKTTNGQATRNYFHVDPISCYKKIIDYELLQGNHPLIETIENNATYSYGNRTPSMYYRASRSSNGDNYINGEIVYLGEYNEQRYCDIKYVNVVVQNNDRILFNGNSMSFRTKNLKADHGKVSITAENSMVYAFGKQMVNKSEIELTIGQEDFQPPTTTFLQVVDQNNEMLLHVKEPENAKIILTAGDFDTYYDDINFSPLSYQNYIGKPIVEIEWTENGIDFHPLTVVENPDLFHESYGNYFSADLEPITQTANPEKWISVRLTVTDEAGNSQKQLLNPLFFYGNGTIDLSEWQIAESKAYPNPFNETVTITTEKALSGNAIFEIYDLNGKIVYQTKITNTRNSFTWNNENLKTGVYFYNVFDENMLYKGKIVKE